MRWPILFGFTETAFRSNGVGVLYDAISCKVTEELNGQYELAMSYPLTGIHAESIADRCIIMAKPNPVADPQPFRIYNIRPSSSGTIVINARHLAYDARGIPIAPFAASSVAEALVNMKAAAAVECPFSFWTDKDTQANLSARTPKSLWRTLGGSKGSILDVYGGEYEFDRYDIHLHNRRGADRGVSIRYGKNLRTLEQDRNCAECYTGVYPYWVYADGETLVQLPEQIITAKGTYDTPNILTLDLSAEWQKAPTVEDLRACAEKYMVDNDIGVPVVSWKVEIVQLEQTEEYKGQALLERVLLGDTVTVVFPLMQVNASARAVKTVFDVLQDRYESVTLGKVKSNLASTIAKQQQEIEKRPSQTMMENIIGRLADSLTGATGGCIRFLDTDDDDMPDELYIADKPDPAYAVKVWRYNYEGWAASTNGYNGPFKLGATLEDGLLAEFVTAAHLIAGTIQSRDPDMFFLDLDNGILRIKALDRLTEDFAALKLDSDAISIAVSKLLSDGVTSVRTETGYRFDADGLWISKLGQEIISRIDNTGMYVSRSGETVLQANADGVEAENIRVRKYLNIGKHSRIEDYKDSAGNEYTACFWV